MILWPLWDFLGRGLLGDIWLLSLYSNFKAEDSH